MSTCWLQSPRITGVRGAGGDKQLDLPIQPRSSVSTTTSNASDKGISYDNLIMDLDKSSTAISDPADMELKINAKELKPNCLDASMIGGAGTVVFQAHGWISGQLKLKVKWANDKSTWEDVELMKADHPCMMAEYLVGRDKVSQKSHLDCNRNLVWARKTVRDFMFST